jgi:hypothetical protein
VHYRHWHAPSYYYAPRYVYQPYPVYRSYYYDPYYYPSNSIYFGGRNFSIGIGF